MTGNLHRFLDAQANTYDIALSELKHGKKMSHWMWFIFPQIRGLGTSETSKFYAIQNLDEAAEYLAHPVLGQRLIACVTTLLTIEGKTAREIMGYPDVLKLRSSMTLFERVADKEKVFSQILDKFYQGQRDDKTIERIVQLDGSK